MSQAPGAVRVELWVPPPEWLGGCRLVPPLNVPARGWLLPW